MTIKISPRPILKTTLGSLAITGLLACFSWSLVGCISSQGASAITDSASSRVPASLDKLDNLDKIEVEVRGGDTQSFLPSNSGLTPIHDKQAYDIIVIGGGLAGLTSSIYLTDANKRVLLLEKEPEFGGLAAWGQTKDNIPYDRGAAYWTDAYEEELEILKHIGLGNFKSRNAIPEPIDSYLVRGEMFEEIWSPHTVAKLPASFALFRFELLRANKDAKIPNQPFEEFEKFGGDVSLDNLTARAWIESMPNSLETFVNAARDSVSEPPSLEEAKQILLRFKKELKENKLHGRTGMEGVIELVDLFSRSALGNVTDHISAMSFANFYISELEVRYTTPHGTGAAALLMEKMLLRRPKTFTGKVSAPVTRIRNIQNGVEVTYQNQGQTFVAKAKYAVFAAQLGLAPRLIEKFEEQAPEQAGLMKDIRYSHYSVHIVETEGHPYRASYDTWTRASDYSEDDFTDLILGNWMHPKMRGYHGYRDFKQDPPLANSILGIYQPLPQKWIDRAYSDSEAKSLALQSTKRMYELYSKLPEHLWRGPLTIKRIETSRWPLSVHITRPGYFTKIARKLRQPVGRVFFANNNLGSPAFEEALFRGHCAAVNILKRMNTSYKPVKWTRCPIEQPSR